MRFLALFFLLLIPFFSQGQHTLVLTNGQWLGVSKFKAVTDTTVLVDTDISDNMSVPLRMIDHATLSGVKYQNLKSSTFCSNAGATIAFSRETANNDMPQVMPTTVRRLRKGGNNLKAAGYVMLFGSVATGFVAFVSPVASIITGAATFIASTVCLIVAGDQIAKAASTLDR